MMALSRATMSALALAALTLVSRPATAQVSLVGD
jgi:hypothetical protein